MRNPSAVRVTHGVLHLVGDGRHRATVLSESPLDLDDATDARAFIAAHIQNSLSAEQALSARFTDAQGIVATSCRSVFNHPRRFLAESQQITRCLGAIVTDDRRIASGGLLVAQFTAEYPDGVQEACRHLAILKLDPSDGFVPRTQHHDGHVRVTLQKVDRVVPTAREKLQKCAFVCHPDGGARLPNGCELLVLDRQHRGDDQPADFFMTRFLIAGRATDDITLTQTFGDITIRTINRLFNDGLVDDQVRNELYTHRTAALRSNVLNVERFIEALPVSDEARQIVRERFAPIAEREFAPDEQTAIRLTRTTRFRGDYGLNLSIQSDHFADVVDAERIENDAERGPHWRVTVRTREWQRVRGN